MAALSDRAVLDVWEAGSARHPIDRRLILLAGADPNASLEQLAALDVQERDMALLEIRRHTFGDALELQESCRGCGITLEFEVSADALREIAPTTDRVVHAKGWQIEFRLPTSIDLASVISDDGDLFAACVEEARRAGELAPVEEIPEQVKAEVEEAMASTAPASDIEFAATCEECQAENLIQFDPGAFLWDEVSARARRLMTEVVVLARAFGWAESQVLALSPRRRRTYLEAVT